MFFRTKPAGGLPIDRLETYQEGKWGWRMYKDESTLEAKKTSEGESEVIDSLD